MVHRADPASHDDYFEVSDMLRSARERQPGLTLVQADVTSECFTPGAFDVVLCAHNGLDSLHLYRQRLRTMKYLRDLVKAAGVVVYSSHLLPRQGGHTGYQVDPCHGSRLRNFAGSKEFLLAEANSVGLDVVAAREVVRRGVPIWLYVVARPSDGCQQHTREGS